MEDRAVTEATVTAAATGAAAAFTRRVGVVQDFDDHEGRGRVRDDTTGEVWTFHCTRIQGGTRTIAAEAAVSFRVEPGPVGLEAVAVTAA